MTEEKNITNIIHNTIAEVKYYNEEQTVICVLSQNFVTYDDFKELFNELGDFIRLNPVEKFILDKRNLTVFDQPSMTWYHVTWKAEMKLFGLDTYRKLLPDNKVFRTSVEIGKTRIEKENPQFKFDDYDIQYTESIEQAFAK